MTATEDDLVFLQSHLLPTEKVLWAATRPYPLAYRPSTIVFTLPIVLIVIGATWGTYADGAAFCSEITSTNCLTLYYIVPSILTFIWLAQFFEMLRISISGTGQAKSLNVLTDQRFFAITSWPWTSLRAVSLKGTNPQNKRINRLVFSDCRSYVLRPDEIDTVIALIRKTQSGVDK